MHWLRSLYLFPLTSRIASQHNPDINYELKVVQSLAYARAFETECILIACNAGGDRAQDGFMGGSGVWAPLLGKFGGFEGEEVGVRVVDVDMGILKVSSNPPLGAIRGEG
jgi:predicted amidohydrolase